MRTVVLPLRVVLAIPSTTATAAPAWQALRAEVEGYTAATCLTRQEQPFLRKQGYFWPAGILNG